MLLSSKRMYSPGSPTFSSLDRSSAIAAAAANAAAAIHCSSSSSTTTTSHNFPQFSGASLTDDIYDATGAISYTGGSGIGNGSSLSQCVKIKYFTTFIICTTCLALLSASLATHKWIISKPIRILRLNGGQAVNLTSLMLTAQQDNSNNNNNNNNNNNREQTNHDRYRYPSPLLLSLNNPNSEVSSTIYHHHHQPIDQLTTTTTSQLQQKNQDNKFQGEIYFGLFKGVKVLNHGFGDRYIPISVWQTLFSTKPTTTDGTVTSTGPQQQQATGTGTGTIQPQHQQQELVNFKLWLLTLVSVVLAILFALIGSIFAIINFVITPRGTLSGPVGLAIWNAAACFACLLAIISWLIEYFVRLQTNVLSQEEIQNGWTSESRSQFGYSYYFVVAAFVLHLVNIFIVSIVQFETWNQNKATKRQSRALCEGVIMLY